MMRHGSASLLSGKIKRARKREKLSSLFRVMGWKRLAKRRSAEKLEYVPSVEAGRIKTDRAVKAAAAGKINGIL